MTQMQSLTKYEHQVLPKLRDHLNQSESVEDVKKFYIATVQEFIELATGGKLEIDYDDVALTPEKEPFYTLSQKVMSSEAMKELGDSDFDSVMHRMAEQAAHRHAHLMKNNTKTNLKIKNH